ncbi:aspartyl/asparaginyl beta-hydroxylase isoform X6 [Scaptodrosophila lebanonensis]|nr:aspartyl/asparaginyl beta-hydroxylase isoform X6 [Scaptodrosophila lebanonensis]
MNQEACMRRRLTIASAEDHIPDDDEELPPLDDEYSEEEIEIEEEIEVEISDIDEAADGVEGGSDDNVAASHSYVPETFEQLSAQYKSKQEAQQEPKEITAVSTAAPTKTREQISTPKTSASDPEPTVSTDIYVEYEDGAAEDYAQDENDEITDEEDEIDDDYGYELEEGDISDVDDTELMNRLEAKYGRLPAKEYESDADSDDPTWTQIKPKEAAPGAGPKAKLNTDDDDDLFEAELRKANAEMIRENPNPANALRAFNNLIIKYTHKSSAHLARARALEQLAEIRQSNEILEQAIDSYKRYLAFAELISDDGEFRAAGERCIEHLRFMGYQQQAVAIHELLIDRFWEEPQQRNQLTLTYLMINNLELVRRTAGNTLKIWPQDALAQLYYGLAVKQLDRDYARALPYLKYGMESGLRGTQEGFFYLALGETLQRLGKQSEALAVYERGVEKQFFPSVYQRALYNEPHLRAQPFWDVAETGYAESFEKLQRNWSAIRDEALALLNHHGNFQEETEQLRDTGDWTQYELYAQGQRVGRNCQRAPITCALLAGFFPAATSCRRGQVKFSAMRAQTHVWPHCGPTNCRLRAHLGLVTPEPQLTSLRVAEQLRTWQAGELFIFDDSFEHEVWHNGTELRLVLIVDVWHPDLTADQRLSMSEI